MDLIVKFYDDETGAPAVEYALLVAFITIAIAASVQNFATSVGKLFNIPWP